MIVVGADKTIYLNGAIVPRVRRLVVEQGTDSTNSMNNKTSVFSPGSRGTLRAFTLVEILEGRVDKIAETWVSVTDDETAFRRGAYLFLTYSLKLEPNSRLVWLNFKWMEAKFKWTNYCTRFGN
ncbi:hypothetical protein OIU84_010430 [Salix udensis]|uniref:Uncharacterized protein n=1 Tax=Salix udensis TaxID=889485 RepID=A0AAD6JKP1_9ROSI|nr:hypothetical protein OIU84_010430 [Salix udensis]